ncbi:hypothetical protein GQ43DRAFT_471976 [Delitschia confertaspora ATCC 74209]|uniref:Rhodopsin domain-containing protein n=1 Tax=Delitschia confertaspora ATCC 74209 TaxID=1513339 RepID=A0A9P4JLC8_9PLEO|nr:hypothetical protein GQ43DRAFT_471976 [Delitschia confertaspora ATCC 74209]
MASNPGVSVLPPPPPKVSEHAFLGIVWGGFTLATLFVASRCALRYKAFRRFYLDDAFVALAWLIVLATSITWQILVRDMFLDNSVARGLQMPPVDFVERVERFLKGSAAIVFLFYSTLWSIKLSFLFFFRRLYPPVGRWNGFWWAIFGVTMASYFVCIGDIEYNCLVMPLTKIAAKCSSEKSIRFQRMTLIANCVLDVLTDVLITVIPFTMLWKVRISMRRKLALAGVFSVTMVTIIFSIVRASVITSNSIQPDMSWLYTWSNIEVYTGIYLLLPRPSHSHSANNHPALIVSSLGSFRSLFRSQDSSRPTPRRSDDSPPTFGSPMRNPIRKKWHSMIYTSDISGMTKLGSNTELKTNDSEAQQIIDMYRGEKRQSSLGSQTTSDYRHSNENAQRGVNAHAFP